MRRFIKRLRNKSPELRHRIALGTSAAVTVFIFFGWVTIASQGVLFSDQTEAESTTQTASPLSAFSENASAAIGEFSASFPSLSFSSDESALSSDAAETTQGSSTNATMQNESQSPEQESVSEETPTVPAYNQPYWEANDPEMPSDEAQGGYW